MTDVDVIVIGAGPAGENVVDRVIRGGLSCAVVEEHLAGGECSYYACIPSKALLRPMELEAEVARVPGLSTTPIDVEQVLARRDQAVSDWDDAGQAAWLAGLPTALHRGRGRLVAEKEVEVTAPDGGVTRLRARLAVVLATGSVPVDPPVQGLRDVGPWFSRQATSVKEVPSRLIVLGGGVVACEMAQALHALGATQTTMLVRGNGLLGRVEPFAGQLVATSMRDRGIDVRFGVGLVQVSRPSGDPGAIVAELSTGETIEADELLVAAGRIPAVDDVGLETIGLTAIRVDDTLRVQEHDWLYAVGDVNGKNLLTHMGKYQARICGDAIVARARGDRPAVRDVADERAVPQVVFTDPQVCSVGLTESEARAAGLDIRVVEYDLGNVSGAYLLGDGYSGRAKAVVDESGKVLVGVTFAGPGVAELLHAATIAVTAQVPLDTLWHAVPSFPTVSEVWLRLLEEYGF